MRASFMASSNETRFPPLCRNRHRDPSFYKGITHQDQGGERYGGSYSWWAPATRCVPAAGSMATDISQGFSKQIDIASNGMSVSVLSQSFWIGRSKCLQLFQRVAQILVKPRDWIQGGQLHWNSIGKALFYFKKLFKVNRSKRRPWFVQRMPFATD